MSWLEDAVASAVAQTPVVPDKIIPARVKGRVLIVDGDYLAYYCSGNDETDPAVARISAISRLENMRDMSGCDSIVVHLTSSGSTKGDRYIVATVKQYQAQRAGRRPKNWQYLRDWMEGYGGTLFTTKTWGSREADDGMAYHAAVLGVDNAVISTADKDLRMVPAIHLGWRSYTLTRLDGEFCVVGEDDKVYGHKWFWLQVLQGDTADNIPGLPKYVVGWKEKPCGEKTAEKLLSTVHNDSEALNVVSALYHSYYKDKWADRLVEQMVLLWMRRDAAARLDDAMSWIIKDDHPLYRAMDEAMCRLVARVEAAKNEVANIGTN